MGFYAGRREPPGSGVLLGVAQLDAPAMRHRLMAVAVARWRGSGLQAGRHVAIEPDDR